MVSKGEPMPYNGVAVGLETYRTETAKIKKQDEVIAGLRKELAGRKQEQAATERILVVDSAAYTKERELRLSAEKAAEAIAANLENCVKQSQKLGPKWFERPAVIAPAAAVIGVLLGVKFSR